MVVDSVLVSMVKSKGLAVLPSREKVGKDETFITRDESHSSATIDFCWGRTDGIVDSPATNFYRATILSSRPICTSTSIYFCCTSVVVQTIAEEQNMAYHYYFLSKH